MRTYISLIEKFKGKSQMNKTAYFDSKNFIEQLLTAINLYRNATSVSLTEPEEFGDNEYSFGVQTAINDIPFYFGKFKKGRKGFEPVEDMPSVDIWFDCENFKHNEVQLDFCRKLEIIAADWKFHNGTYISNVSKEGGVIWFLLADKHFKELTDESLSDEIKQHVLTQFFAEVMELL
ncbi:hypothetical protein [uncultured Treponema sp.]|uniref:hypothetical protein n=1 Tax=uncultured Treponema sp. TaxID=162155 RepID=UPI0025DE33C2|nr:hypothetical protein [uncultured Treponema sp.]